MGWFLSFAHVLERIDIFYPKPTVVTSPQIGTMARLAVR